MLKLTLTKINKCCRSIVHSLLMLTNETNCKVLLMLFLKMRRKIQGIKT